MGGSSSQHQESKNTIDPMQFQQYQSNYQHAQGVADTLTPYTGQITAGFNPTQIQSQGVLSGIANDPRYQATNQNAIDATQGVLGTNFQGYDPSQLAGQDLSKYYDPFQKDVIDASQAQNQYQRQQQGVLDNASATAAHAFGGSRQGVQRAETTAGYDRNDQQNLAALNSANFSQAQQAALADVASQNASKQFNANYALQGANTKLGAANQLANLNSQGLNLATQQGGILASVGDAQQNQTQREFTDAYNAYLQGQQLSLSQQQLLNQALGIIPIQQTTTSDSKTTSNPGLGGILGGVASLGMGLASLPTTSLGGGILGNLFKKPFDMSQVP